MEDDSLFRKPVGDWTDAEIRVGLAELAKVMAAEEPGAVLDGLHALSVVLADAPTAHSRPVSASNTHEITAHNRLVGGIGLRRRVSNS